MPMAVFDAILENSSQCVIFPMRDCACGWCMLARKRDGVEGGSAEGSENGPSDESGLRSDMFEEILCRTKWGCVEGKDGCEGT